MINLEYRVTQSRVTLNATRWALRINAFSCFVFGLIFVLLASDVSHFLGSLPQHWLIIVGVGLLIHTVHLAWVSTQTTVRRLEIFYFSAGDFLWLIGSWLLVAVTDMITTPQGVVASLTVATVVSMIGVAQLWTYSRAVSSQLDSQRVRT